MSRAHNLAMHLDRRYTVPLALLILFGSAYYYFEILIPYVRQAQVAHNLAGGYGLCNDFYPVWLASRELFAGHNPYAQQLVPKIEKGLYGRPLDRRDADDAQVNMRAFAYPLYTIFLLAPVGALSFPAVQIVLSLALPVLAAFTVVLWLHILKSHLCWPGFLVAICLSLASYPVLEGIYAGQPALLAAPLIAAAVAALVYKRYVLAGTLLAMASIKPQMVALIALWTLGWAVSRWSERKRVVFGFLVTTLVLLTVSTLILPNWVSGWVQILREYRHVSPPPLAESVLGRPLGDVLALFLVGICAWLCWKTRFQSADTERFAVCTILVLGTTVLILPSAIAVYDQFLLVPAVVWLFTARDRITGDRLSVRLLALIFLGAVSWQWLSACALTIASVLAPVVVRSPKMVLLPLRTEASVPFALVALLCVVLIRQQRRQPSGV
jgi:Glycosyltransferase family 87